MIINGQYSNKIKIYGYKKNRGLGYALQQGILQCDYDYVAIMDSDDISVKDRFEKQIKYIKSNPNIDVVGGYRQDYDEGMNRKISIRKVPLCNEDIYNKIGKQVTFNHVTAMYKKESVIKSGNYSEGKIEDYKILISMCAHNCKMVNLPDILVNCRAGKDMYKRRTGIGYLKEIKKVEDMLLEHKFINHYQYANNMIVRTIAAIMPSKVKEYVYPKIVRRDF